MKALKVQREEGEGRGTVAKKAYMHLVSREHTTASLSRVLGVSVATTMRVLDGVRKELAARGAELVSVKAGGKWHYEIRENEAALREQWRRSRLRALAGAGKKWRAFRGSTEDEIIYGEA